MPYSNNVIESIVPLGIAGTVVSATRDLYGGGTTGQNIKMEYGAISDVAGGIALETSIDGVTWRRCGYVALAAPDATNSPLFVGKATFSVLLRYVRAVFINGAGAQAQFTFVRMESEI